MAAPYRATIADFLRQSHQEVLGLFPDSAEHNESQKSHKKARSAEIKILKTAFDDLVRRFPAAAQWSLLIDYPVPRRQKPLDAVVLADDVVFCLEFKTEDKSHSTHSERQVEDYALDLRDFHEASFDRQIVPIFVLPKAPSTSDHSPRKTYDGSVGDVLRASESDFASALLTAFESQHQAGRKPIDPKAWDNSSYRPAPTILEAAEALLAGHKIRETMRCHPSSTNLSDASDRLVDIIQQAQKRSEKVVCFVTGAPGAGKTLAGLNLVRHPALQPAGQPAAVFLSSNGPLVKIVSAALSQNGNKQLVPAFIQSAHTFVKELGKSEKPPAEKIIVIDEAQRTWNASQNRKKNKLQGSEAESLLSLMDRHTDWAVLVALIGGSQASRAGEAGISEWGKILREKFPGWKVAVSPNALEGNGSHGGHCLFEGGNSGAVTIRKELFLHLKSGQRSFRAQQLTDWVDAVLMGDSEKAAAIIPKLRDFPLELTRSLSIARGWLKRHARGQQRAGLVASSGAVRLRPDGLELSSAFRQGNRNMYVHWFLAPPPDIRSSNQLEVAASEIECQGLELDWVGVCWGGDLAFDKAINQWRYRQFNGSNWAGLKNDSDREYILNTYRVLLTRARRGLIIWVPNGDPSDRTRSPGLFDPTTEYFARCGLSVL